ncbi:hypothetical protein R1flu_017537 [Riccia fluitans]|uniref:Secreted protein n=1 Tax=Riccia fluitans TaxID=41844 RepID=A0ABD1ZD94_9MARC
MARLNVQLLLLVAVSTMVFSAQVISGRRHVLPFEKDVDIEKYVDILPLFSHQRDESEVLCVGEVSELISMHEVRERCAYDHKGGFRAVGCGYNLDDNVGERMQELRVALADYERVYKGEECLTDMQITGLLAVDAKRALNRAAENVNGLNKFCCSLRAVFADIQHTVGSSSNFPDEMDLVIEKSTSEEFRKAADELERTKWCSQRGNRDRCEDNLDLMDRGCKWQQ